jgi:predicted ATP-dependent endonuclease of OLD family
MKITKACIKNYRLFDGPVTLDFPSSYTALVGKNGNGKTTVLEAINLATSFYFVENKISEDDFNDDTKDIEIEIELDDFFFIIIPDGYQTRRLPSKIVRFVVKHREKAAASKAFSEPYVANHYAIPYEYSDKDGLAIQDKNKVPKSVTKEDELKYKYQRDTSANPGQVSERLLSVSNNLDNFPNIFYFPKNREKDLKKGYFTTFQKITDELNWRFFKEYAKDRENYVALWENIYNAIIEKVDDPKQSKIVHPLKDKLKNIVSEKFDKFEISLFDLKQPFEQAFFSLRDKDKIISLSKLGSGELMIITYFLLKLVSELSKEKIIFLIDEPELHLHPQFQYKLFEEISSSAVQHIYTTHSDILIDLGNWQSINRFDVSHIYPTESLLTQKYGGSSAKELKEHLNDIKTFQQDKTIFFRENNEMLFADKCLLVEGPNDKYGLLELAKKVGYDFSKCTIIYCNSKSKIQYYQTVCLAYGVDFFTIYDQDGNGQHSTIEELAKDENIFSFTTSFEKLIGADRLPQIIDKIQQIEKEDIPKEISTALESVNAFINKR